MSTVHVHDWQDQCEWAVGDTVERPACSAEREIGLSVVRHAIKAIDHGLADTIHYDDGSTAFRVRRDA